VVDLFFFPKSRSTKRNNTCFNKTLPTQGSQKVVRFMQNEPQFILYRVQRANVNINIVELSWR